MPSNVSNHLQLFLITRFQLFSSSVLFKISSCIARTRAGSGLPFTHSETHCWSLKLWTKNRTAWTVFSRNQWDIWRWQLFVLLAILSTNQQTEVFLALPFRCWITVRGTVREGLGEIRTAWNRKHRKNINWTEPGCLVETRLRPEILLNPMSSKTTGWCMCHWRAYVSFYCCPCWCQLACWFLTVAHPHTDTTLLLPFICVTNLAHA